MTSIEQLDKVTNPQTHTNIYKTFLYIYTHFLVLLPNPSKVNCILEQATEIQRRSRCITVLFLYPWR
jgi:hypothetical protein